MTYMIHLDNMVLMYANYSITDSDYQIVFLGDDWLALNWQANQNLWYSLVFGAQPKNYVSPFYLDACYGLQLRWLFKHQAQVFLCFCFCPRMQKYLMVCTILISRGFKLSLLLIRSDRSTFFARLNSSLVWYQHQSALE